MVARRPVATAADPRADIAKQVNGDREADECEYERMVGMAGKIVGHDETPWHVPGTPICPLTAQQDAAAFAAQPPLLCRGPRTDGTSGRHRRLSAQEIVRAHVGTTVPHAHPVSRLLLETKTEV